MMRTLPSRIVPLTLLVLSLSASAQTTPPPDVTYRPLSDAEFTRYLEALNQLVDMGDEIEGELGAADDAKGPGDLATVLGKNEKVKDVITSHGFTPDSFVEVHWNAMMGYMAAELEGRKAEVDAARKQQEAALQAMKAQLPPAQYEQMKKSMGVAQQMLDDYDKVPPENVALAKKHKAAFQAIIDR